MYSETAHMIHYVLTMILAVSLPLVLFCKYYAFAAASLPNKLYNFLATIADEDLKDILLIYLVALFSLFVLAYAWLGMLIGIAGIIFLVKRAR